jgi:hypothetical protein
MLNALLKATKSRLVKISSDKKLTTNINKILENQTIRHLIVNPISSNWVVRNVLHIGISEIKCCVKKGGGDAANMRMLLSLNFMQFIHKFLVMCKQFIVIMENFVTEMVKSVSRNDGGVRISKRDDVNLNQI